MRWIPDSGTLEPREIISQGEALSVDCAIQPAGLTATAQSSLDPVGLFCHSSPQVLGERPQYGTQQGGKPSRLGQN